MKKQFCREQICFLSIFAAFAAGVTTGVSASFSITPDPARVKEISTWLPQAPRATGARITDRAAWTPLAALPEAKGILKRAESLVKSPVPELPDSLYLEFTRTGNRDLYQEPYFMRLKMLNTFLLAECLENKGRFISAIDRILLAICAERSWTMPAHDQSLSNFKKTFLTIDLGSSNRGKQLAMAIDWLRDVLPATTRETVSGEIRRRVLDVYLSAIRAGKVKGNWWINCDNNWNAVCHANVICAALILVEKPEDRAEFVAALERCNPAYLSGFTPDGYCSEGMGYWNYGFGHQLEAGLILRAATGGKLDLFAGERCRKVGAYAWGFQFQQGKSPFFADGGGFPGRINLALLRQVWPDLAPVNACDYTVLAGDSTEISLRAFGQESSLPSPGEGRASLPVRTWFPDAQVLISRLDIEKGKVIPFAVAIKGGHNAEQHNHNDVGSYSIMLDGVEMMGDPGGEVYTRRTFSGKRYESKVLNSFGHPVPVVAGTLQPAGRAYAARVLETVFSPEKDRIMLDLTKAYSVKALKSLVREMVYDRAARAVTITDKVEFTAPCAFSDPLVTYRNLENGKTQGDFFLTDEKNHRVSVSVAVTGSSWKREEEKIENPSKPSPLRLAVTLDRPVKQATVQFRIVCCP